MISKCYDFCNKGNKSLQKIVKNMIFKKKCFWRESRGKKILGKHSPAFNLLNVDSEDKSEGSSVWTSHTHTHTLTD